jgi:glucose-6-phosphate isomerase
MSGPVAVTDRPALVGLDATTGAVAPFTGRYAKRLSDMEGMFRNEAARVAALREGGDPVVYEVIEYRQEGADQFFGTTTIAAGTVDGEFYMTRGHFHRRDDRGEVYFTLAGRGLLVLETRDGRTDVVEMREGTAAAIPPGWAHRSVNTGAGPLVFSWVCAVDAGNDYAAIRERGLRKLVLQRGTEVVIVDNPRQAGAAR